MSTAELPEGFRYVSRRFEGRFSQSRFFGKVEPDPRVMPALHPADTEQQLREKLAQQERHLRKLNARIRRNAAITGKAGRKPEPETLELYQSHFVEGKPWKQCFEELWSKPGRKPPVPHERQRVMRRLRERVKAYAATRQTPRRTTKRAA